MTPAVFETRGCSQNQYGLAGGGVFQPLAAHFSLSGLTWKFDCRREEYPDTYSTG